ncbi:MAG: Fe-Mn family superoxide dismutase [Bacteroidales bacterium]
MAFELTDLPYPLDALEPHISKRTLEFHYGKHHKGYVDKINGLIPGTQYENAALEEIIRTADGSIFNNGAQVWNHTFYWNCMSPEGGGEPFGQLSKLIDQYFGSFSEFKEKFSGAAASLFGSGWVWLVKRADGSLEIVKESNAGNPLRTGMPPLLTLDVWEHAYYLDHQNQRPAYIEGFWKLVDWKAVEQRL